jgi:hypothetical protein
VNRAALQIDLNAYARELADAWVAGNYGRVFKALEPDNGHCQNETPQERMRIDEARQAGCLYLACAIYRVMLRREAECPPSKFEILPSTSFLALLQARATP